MATGTGGGDGTLNDLSKPIFSKGQVSTLEKLYEILGDVVDTQEKELNDEIDKLSQDGGTIDQGMLLKVQGMVQTWGVTTGLATGTLRAAGDCFTKTTNNIR